MKSDSALRTLRIDSLAHLGAGISKNGGKVVFVPGTVPGDLIQARIVEEKSRFARGEIVNLLEPSPDRVEPPCPYFGECGGCQWQHIAYPTQLRYKTQIVREQMAHVGGLAAVEVRDILRMETPWNYRNGARFTPNAEGHLGFQRAESNEVVPIAECLIVHSAVNEVCQTVGLEFPELEALSVRVGTRTGERMIVLETQDDEPPEIESDVPVSVTLAMEGGVSATLVGMPVLHEEVAGRLYRISPTSFFQVNTWGADRLVQTVIGALEPQGGERLLDLYCGVGLFSLALADKVEQVIGVESSPSAIADARANAEGLGNITFLEGLAEEVLPSLEGSLDLAVVDPPRGGIHPRALQALVEKQPRRIAYVSCEPTTLARDCATLAGAGYRLHWAQPVDMFPQTYHIESVALLER